MTSISSDVDFANALWSVRRRLLVVLNDLGFGVRAGPLRNHCVMFGDVGAGTSKCRSSYMPNIHDALQRNRVHPIAHPIRSQQHGILTPRREHTYFMAHDAHRAQHNCQRAEHAAAVAYGMNNLDKDVKSQLIISVPGVLSINCVHSKYRITVA